MVRASFLGNILRTEIIHTWDSHMLGHEGRREFNTQNDTRDTTRVGRCSQTHPLALGWLKWWEDPKCVPLDRDRSERIQCTRAMVAGSHLLAAPVELWLDTDGECIGFLQLL